MTKEDPMDEYRGDAPPSERTYSFETRIEGKTVVFNTTVPAPITIHEIESDLREILEMLSD